MKTILYIFFGISFLLISCSQKVDMVDPGPENPLSIELAEGSDLVIESLNEFGLDIFQLLVEDEPENENVFISPTSISLALAMTLNGANTTTEDSMAFAMRVDHLSGGQINETYRDLIAGLKTCDDKVLLEIANSIWCRQGFPVEPSFLDINNTFYNAEIATLDFSDPATLERINDWVAEQTHDKIPDIIDRIDPDNIMFLINAIYFKGIWSIDFNKENTREEPFYLANSDSRMVSMMNMEEEIGYFENDLFQACELDYGRGNYSMIVLLPKYNVGLNAMIGQLHADNWNKWSSSFSSQQINLRLPKFTFDYEIKLNEILGVMGMGVAFDSHEADFTGINPIGGIYIAYVKHKTFVEVNEEGTEAAAATVVAMNYTSVGPSGPIQMTVNRPFVFAIREKTTHSIVFIGKVAEPVTE